MIGVVTDSAANLSPEQAEASGIEVVPLDIIFGSETLRDGVDITPGEFYRRLRAQHESPRTACPAPGRFVAAFEKLAPHCQGIICLTLSAKLSSTYNAAREAAQMLRYPITVLDTGLIALCQGFAALAAAAYGSTSNSLSEVVQATEGVLKRVGLWAVLDTLEYAVRGGRVGWAAGWLANVLHIKPVITLNGGKVKPVARLRTRSAEHSFLLEKGVELAADAHNLQLAVLHADLPEEAKALVERLRQRLPGAQTYLAEVTPLLGVHSGPGALGLTYLRGE